MIPHLLTRFTEPTPMPLPDISTPEARELFKWDNRQGAPEFDWEAAILGTTWRDSRRSGVALIVHPTVWACDWRGGEPKEVAAHHTGVEWQRFRVESQRQENARRLRATPELCAVVLMGYVEGRRVYAEKLGAALGDFLTKTLVADHSAPSEAEMARFLMGELDADPAIARAAAAKAWTWADPRRFLKEIYEAWEGPRP